VKVSLLASSFRARAAAESKVKSSAEELEFLDLEELELRFEPEEKLEPEL
jgi:hypothetical protein